MKAEFLVQPIGSIPGFKPTEEERGLREVEALLKEILAPVRHGVLRYAANIVIYENHDADWVAKTAATFAQPHDTIWRVGNGSGELEAGVLWVRDDHPALAMINARVVYIPDDYQKIRDSWTARADVALAKDNHHTRFYGAQGYRLDKPGNPPPGPGGETPRHRPDATLGALGTHWPSVSQTIPYSAFAYLSGEPKDLPPSEVSGLKMTPKLHSDKILLVKIEISEKLLAEEKNMWCRVTFRDKATQKDVCQPIELKIAKDGGRWEECDVSLAQINLPSELEVRAELIPAR